MTRKVSAAKTKNTTTKDTLFTVPARNTGLWTVMYVISLTANETPKVYWYDSSANTEYFIIGGKNLGAGDYILLADKEVVLQSGDEIRIQNTGTNSVTYIATVELVPEMAVQYHN